MITYKISEEIKKKLKEDEEKNKNSEPKNNDFSAQNEIKNNDNNVQNDNFKQENTTKDNALKNKNLSEIIDDINSMKKDYISKDYVDAPNSLGLEEVKIKEKSDDEFADLAKQSLNLKYDTKKKNTKDTFESKISEIIKDNENLYKNKDQSINKVNEYFDNSKNETENQALKRGLARSSIVISELSKIEGDRAKELSSVLDNLQSNIYQNEIKIDSLSNQMEEALGNLDIEYAIELSDKIASLKNEFEKEKQEAIKFNNNVKKLEAEYKLDLDKQKQDKQKQTLTLEDKYGVDFFQLELAEKKYDYLKNYFDSLDPKYALSLFLTNKDLKTILGDNYSKMYKYLNERI